jgi:outer membrane protein OmpA-like peptidoglycan-associated protein
MKTHINKTTSPVHPLTLVLALSACSIGYPSSNVQKDTAIGAIAGAVIGHQMDHDKGSIIGAAIGALAGASVGNYQDQQQQELERVLAQEQIDQSIEIQRLQNETLKVSLSSATSFAFDSAELKPEFFRALDSLTRSLVHYDKTVLHIIGHTDSIGSEDYNYGLSVRRAEAVAQYLMLKGVPAIRLRIEGHGELEPRSPNTSEALRNRNRRVEIFIKPVVEGYENDALITPYPN